MRPARKARTSPTYREYVKRSQRRERVDGRSNAGVVLLRAPSTWRFAVVTGPEPDPSRLLSALRPWNPWWQDDPVLEPGLVDRDVFPHAAGWLGKVPVLAICGMRRSGKSTLMRQLIDHLLRTGRASPDEILLAHFEEPV